MKAELKRLHSPDIEDLENYKPNIIDDFSFLLQIFVGELNEEGEESFDTIVCTPKWLLTNCKENEVVFGFNYIIVPVYDYNLIFEKIRIFISNVEGKNWDDIACKISKIGKWEFEDYQNDII